MLLGINGGVGVCWAQLSSLCCVSFVPVAIISDLALLLNSLPAPEVRGGRPSDTAQTDSWAQHTLAPPWLDHLVMGGHCVLPSDGN